MTPKEKAQDLIETFTFNCRECDNAMLSAQFAVDEILEAIQYLEPNIVLVSLSEYWLEIKEEIKKL